MAGSIEDNVGLGAPDVSDAEVRAALTAAGAGDLYPADVVGEDGAGLSAGQRQRVAVARALLRCRRGVRLVLLDEPTEHLDRLTEAQLLRSVRALARDPANPCAVLLITHREAAAQAADRVVTIGASELEFAGGVCAAG
jgi:ATP-binding cassette subfamily C protein CydCD